ncbi:MAG: alpha-1,4-glucan--maltose-1-phosphate maltosyltransferase [Bacteroidales bacterium]|nr:alpha-1,4-glucan--maltose-1-phosphate maltosyltransferase [Bacteroidales bacterium]
MEKVKQRVIIENISPGVNDGEFAAKVVLGEKVKVEADIFLDGHDLITAKLLHRKKGEQEWRGASMYHMMNDRWRGWFLAEELGWYEFTIEAWLDEFKTWTHNLKKKVDTGVDVSIELLAGAQIIKDSMNEATEKNALLEYESTLADESKPLESRIETAFDEDLAKLMHKYPVRKNPIRYERIIPVEVDRKRAAFSNWYEFFPRSAKLDGQTHGSFKDMIELLPYIAGMGFNVLYLPPIHPIGITNRKGRNNSLNPGKDDPGSPWAIGNKDGGHKSIHPELGTLDDFKELIEESHKEDMEIALDIAFQCSPDHPYVKEHPEWFKKRPDGSIQYAENPPKKYEDIYPFDFECDDWENLWEELKSIFEFWIEQGVKIFRVDNPHTKPFRFWHYVINDIKKEHPEVIFLAEAFTRPKVMNQLAKLGFNQSYTYFAWRNTKEGLQEYLTQLTQTEMKHFFRPNFWPNTPDILTEYLQSGGRPAFMNRLVLAATLSSNYGIYGPAFELVENRAREFGSEEYLDSEKYQLRAWNLDEKHSLKHYIKRVNKIRAENPALQSMENLVFHPVDNEFIIAYSKQTNDGKNLILVLVNFDPFHTHSGWINLQLADIAIKPGESYQVYDLLGDSWHIWTGAHNYVELNPHTSPAHIFRIRRKVRTERDFDYFM